MSEFSGWKRFENDPFETVNGPFYYRIDDHDKVLCAFRAEQKNMSLRDAMHGGCMMAFADFALFAIAYKKLNGQRAVTLSLNSEFIAPAYIGDLIEATGEVIKSTGSLLFVRGAVTTNGEPMLNFSGILKKLKRKE